MLSRGGIWSIALRAEERRDMEGGKRGWLCNTLADPSFFLLSVSKFSPMVSIYPQLRGATANQCQLLTRA